MNLLLWGCESWALRESLLNKLDVFLHRSIRRILGISILQVKDEKISNKTIRKTLFNIPDIRSQIAIRQMTFIGKVARGPNSQPAKMLLSAWVDNPRLPGGVLTTNKKSIVKSLQILLPDEMSETIHVKDKETGHMIAKQKLNNSGKMKLWLKVAMDTILWRWHICKLKQPGVEIPRPDP